MVVFDMDNRIMELEERERSAESLLGIWANAASSAEHRQCGEQPATGAEAPVTKHL